MFSITKGRFALAPVAAGICAFSAAAPALAADFQTPDKNWTFSVDGNVNVHYIFSSCESAANSKSVSGGLACSGSATGSSVSSVDNGLLPAAISFGLATTQEGFDIAAHFGFYPGIDTNDGGSPNLKSGSSNTALGTTGLDVRQVYMTFGNKNVGTFTLGRNFGLFGFDAIINDMTIPGVGAGGSAASTGPANTTLGSIGLGYIYCDTLAQMNYTTPTFGGANFTLGIYNTLNPLVEPTGATDLPRTSPGVHGKLAYKGDFGAAKLSLSSSFISQKIKYEVGPALTNYTAFGIDVFAMADIADFEGFAYYYHGSGMGTTGLFVFSDDGAGHKRASNGYLLQGTYKLGKLKLGLNYGDSRLDLASGEASSSLVKSNSKVTGGAYYALTKNLTVLGEVTDVSSKSHLGDSNRSLNFNVGAFLAF